MNKLELRWNGWGLLDAPDTLGDKAEDIWKWLGAYMGAGTLPHTPAIPLDAVALPPSRLNETQLHALQAIGSAEQVKTDPFERAYHARGRSYHDLLYLRAGKLDTAPDAVFYPKTAAEVEQLVAYAVEHRVALIPYGGGSSVVGGVTPLHTQTQHAVITVDMACMNQVLTIDKTTMTAHVQAGIYGPALEAALQAEGLTLGHYPQSFEYSTLGGWIASRGAGHQSNRYGKAEDWFIAAQIATPLGLWTTEHFPKSAAGPQLRDLLPGSEGAFGIITDAWIRLSPLPETKAYRAYFFQDFESGLQGARALLQEGVHTAMIRLSDANETFFYSVLHGGAEVAENGPMGFCLMLVGFEGIADQAAHEQARTAAILERCGGADMGSGFGELWLNTRFETPYLRDPMMDHGLGVDTMETAIDWARLPRLHERASAALEKALAENNPNPGAPGIAMAHLSHSYSHGASLYFTVVFPRKTDAEVAQWLAIKKAVSDAIVENGGTISHHHGVGTDHLPWLAAEKGSLGIELLQAVKAKVDPHHIMNPGKLLEMP
ncbi:MAG: FAD-binding oxidoreductase [Candidatus Hydrogenedentales bacterium]|jgi:alkyldihydroxyacetonephosphate synthase